MWSKVQELWERLRPVDRARWSCGQFHDLDQIPIEIRERVANSYPPNHNYSIAADRLIPSRKLAARVAHFRQFYPPCLESLLDLSCSKGFFLFDAANTKTCERVMGIDLCEPTLETCRQLIPHFDNPARIAIARLT
ncbi:MAG: hypothetical protein JWN70_6092, partial [Planctomycetaceae bacterium]|nr:hypothetical protein [Planctomycetaceae bacterium]